MSADLIKQVFGYSRAKGTDLLVLVALAEFFNAKRGDDTAWPSLQKLSNRVKLTVPGLCKILRRLEAMGEAIAFPYLRNGQLINLKYRSISEKHFRLEPQIPFLMIDGHMRFDARDVEDWLRSRRSDAPTVPPRVVETTSHSQCGNQAETSGL